MTSSCPSLDLPGLGWIPHTQLGLSQLGTIMTLTSQLPLLDAELPVQELWSHGAGEAHGKAPVSTPSGARVDRGKLELTWRCACCAVVVVVYVYLRACCKVIPQDVITAPRHQGNIRDAIIVSSSRPNNSPPSPRISSMPPTIVSRSLRCTTRTTTTSTPPKINCVHD
ncbi:hypothetical protein F5Y15DRAFT_332049 [Xylariaceae sp. FL0016]|nr:hypothetical protein F5Y15DRAFT_332049 [Xylariaceae sp. FL0016]